MGRHSSIRGGITHPLPGRPHGQVVVYTTIVNSDFTVVSEAAALVDPVTVDAMLANSWGETDRPWLCCHLAWGELQREVLKLTLMDRVFFSGSLMAMNVDPKRLILSLENSPS